MQDVTLRQRIHALAGSRPGRSGRAAAAAVLLGAAALILFSPRWWARAELDLDTRIDYVRGAVVVVRGGWMMGQHEQPAAGPSASVWGSW